MIARTPLKDRVLPDYTRGEDIANMVTHIIGGVLGIVVLVLSVLVSALHHNVWGIVSSAIYGTSMIALYSVSSVYHGLRPGMGKKVMQVIDHCTIYLLIAGTYTPVSFALAPLWRNAIIAGMWVCTTIALIIHVIWISAPRWLYVLVYIIFGVSVLGIPLCWPRRRDSALRRWSLLHRWSHRICTAQAGSMAKGLRIPRDFPYRHRSRIRLPYGGYLYGDRAIVAAILTTTADDEGPFPSWWWERAFNVAKTSNQASGLASLMVTEISRPFGAV